MECETCSKSFSCKIDLNAHIRRSHRAPDLWCDLCGTYKTKYNFHLQRHRKKCGGFDAAQLRKRPIACPLCFLKIPGRGATLAHYKDEHGIQMDPKNVDLPSISAFEEWKKNIEAEGCFRFVSYDTKGNTKTYRCFRDGCFRSKGSGKRRLKLKGSCKIDGVCPCSLKVVTSKDTGKVKVKYVPSHVGHAFDMGRLNLSLEERQNIAEKLAQHISMDIILDSIRESIDAKYSRIPRTMQKDLAHVKESFQTTDGLLRSDDSTSMETWIRSNTSKGMVRFYKPQSVILPDHPGLTEEDVVLVIAFDKQLEMLSKFGSEVICFDRTHGTSAYDFELHTLMVKDAKSRGFPCAFLISNRYDSTILSLFVTVISRLLPGPLAPKVLMTDMSEVYWNGWCSILPNPTNWLFCQWHVDQAWRKNLDEIHDPFKRCMVYKMLRMVMDEPEEHCFQQLLKGTLDFMTNDPCLSEFEKYFRSEYSARCSSWAFCYRKYLGINTNMTLERMHKVLKYIYLEGKKVKRLDKALTAIVRFVRDESLNQSGPERKKLTSRIKSIRDRHDKALSMECGIFPQQDSSWIVSSLSGETYEVKKLLNVRCCQDLCKICMVCIHQYSCTCVDAKKSNLCKHIHRIAMVNRRIEPEGLSEEPMSDLVIADSDSNTVEEAFLLPKNRAPRPSCSQVAKAKETVMQIISSCLQSAETMEEMNVILSQVTPTPHLLQAVESGLKFHTPSKYNPRASLPSKIPKFN